MARIHRHPFYNLYTLDYDVALLELAGPVRRSRLVRPICLPEPAPRPPDGARCVITGWGSVREGGRRAGASARPPSPGPACRGGGPTVQGGRAAPAARLPRRLDGAAAAEGGRAPPERADVSPLLPGADQQPHAVRGLPAGRRGQLLGERTLPLKEGLRGGGVQVPPGRRASSPRSRAPQPGPTLQCELLTRIEPGTFSAVEFSLRLFGVHHEPISTPARPPRAPQSRDGRGSRARRFRLRDHSGGGSVDACQPDEWVILALKPSPR